MLTSFALFFLGLLVGVLIMPAVFRKEFWGGYCLGRRQGESMVKMSFAGPIWCGSCTNQVEKDFPRRCEIPKEDI